MLMAKWYAARKALVPENAMDIAASVFIYDDESGLHHDYEMWLEELALHAPVDQYRHNRIARTPVPGEGTELPTRI